MLDLIFRFANTFALLCWVALIFTPRARLTTLLVHRAAAPLLLAGAYALTLAVWGRAAFHDGGFSSLPAVEALFRHRGALLAGWLHYLAFDLFVGGWISRDGLERGARSWQLAPFLLLTFMFGPVGLLLYRLFRWRWLR
jgi:hypothetical protein